MAQDQLEEIKQKINVVDLVGEYVPLKKAGRNFKGLCPFHSETAPSFIVSPERQIFKCFGCGEGGDIFGFLMKIEGMEFGEALKKLASRAGVKLKPFKFSKETERKQQLWEINHLASEFFHFLLMKHQVGKRALDYILGRGISRESLEKFKIGYSPNMWDGLQRFMIGKKKYKPADLAEAGLIIERNRQYVKRNMSPSYYDRFRGRLMFPLRDHQGNICGFAGRVLAKEAKEAKYVNSPETPIYHKSRLLYGLWLTRAEIKKVDRVVVVEGELDAISSYQAGVREVVAIKGSALTEEQLRLMSRFTNNLVLALDSDLAGDASARRGIELADRAGFSIKVVEVKGGKDPDEVAQKSPDRWRKMVEGAVSIYDYFLDSAFGRHDARTAEGKRKIGQELVPILGKITSEIVRAHYVSQLAARLRVSEEVVIREIEKLPSQELGKPSSRVVLDSTKKRRREVLEEYLLALGFQSGRWSFLGKKKIGKLIVIPGHAGIIKVLKKYLLKYKSFKSKRLAKMLPAELVEIFNELYLADLGDWLEDEEQVDQELVKIARNLEKLAVKDELTLIGREIKALEKEKGGEKKLSQLNERFRRFSAQLAEF
jgi:DNA primase